MKPEKEIGKCEVPNNLESSTKKFMQSSERKALMTNHGHCDG